MCVRHLGIAALLVAVGCSTPTTPSSEGRAEASQPAPRTPEQAPREPPSLSPEDLELIAADPTTLSPEQRRKRGYALRRKIMQEPDSAAARTLDDLKRAHEEGLLELPPPKGDQGVVLSTPGAKTPGGPGPAGSEPETEPAEATP